MKQPWLIQRLQKPKNFDNPFNFGGGFLNGGFNKQSMDLMRPIFSFDYMGAAEFEWGAVPDAFKNLINLHIKNLNQVGSVKVKTKAKKTAEVYYLCPDNIVDEVKQFLKDLAAEKGIRLKERTHLTQNIDGDEYSKDDVGWIELDNPFMFFTDKDMYDKVVDLFGRFRE